MIIDGRRIDLTTPPYVIAEMSANHCGDLKTAFSIIEEAKKAGADAVKIQTYRADTITIDSSQPDFRITEGLWAGRTLFELYEKAYTPWEWHPLLFEHAKQVGITIFSSPFDSTAVDLLEKLGTPAYKIASFEATDHSLIEYVARTGKPVIISTGMADSEEIAEAIGSARKGGCKDIAILHCVSGYPAPASDYNLRTISDMRERFGLITGLSDHTLGNATAITSVGLGAQIIEKHFTLDRNNGSPDAMFSLTPSELKQLCQDIKMSWESLGNVDYGLKSSERDNVKFRRSLYIVKDVKKGEVLSDKHVRSIRPGYGISSKHLHFVLGKKVKKDLGSGTALNFDMLTDD